MSISRDWPLFGLRIDTPRLSLSYPTDDDLDELNTVISHGIHDAAAMPFDIPWTDDPPEVRPRNSLQFWWGLRASWRPDRWTLTMVVREDRTVVGVQDIFGSEFRVVGVAAAGEGAQHLFAVEVGEEAFGHFAALAIKIVFEDHVAEFVEDDLLPVPF